MRRCDNSNPPRSTLLCCMVGKAQLSGSNNCTLPDQMAKLHAAVSVEPVQTATARAKARHSKRVEGHEGDDGRDAEPSQGSPMQNHQILATSHTAAPGAATACSTPTSTGTEAVGQGCATPITSQDATGKGQEGAGGLPRGRQSSKHNACYHSTGILRSRPHGRRVVFRNARCQSPHGCNGTHGRPHPPLGDVNETSGWCNQFHGSCNWRNRGHPASVR